ncbi:unnamed protein product [Microthlaspi erraticum]|uniref:F-box domain-containing protein n=1 Tax=Microthlaspi erraticum TaxID=1685480 RepID=A0A6D2I070_9BRAS|nr:unnamed protein product [Microthlaspi erraticum]CAA7018629.1 unnamed protein product [Microthlaspi erraticum]
MAAEEIQPHKKKKKKTSRQPSSSISSLSFSSFPDEIKETILARVSRWKYPWLSLVSKRFCSLLSSKEIYKARSQIGAKETCFYVCLSHKDSHPSWFSLWTKPGAKRKAKGKGRKNWFNKDSSGTSVVRTPFSSSQCPLVPDHFTLTVGSEFYIIGGPYQKPSSSVRVLDCRSHTWRDAPNMIVARENPFAAFVDEKIYVMGGCEIDEYPSNWIEVFDMKTQSWTALPGPGADEAELRYLLRRGYNHDLVEVFEGKLYVAIEEKEYAYGVKDGTWKLVRPKSSFLLEYQMCSCEIENVIYCCTGYGVLMWSYSSGTEGREWRDIEGLEELREDRSRGLESEGSSKFLVENYGGKLLVMWQISGKKQRNKIWYAKISLESRCNGREVWGNVECVDMLTFPVESFESFQCLTASV